MATAKAIGWYQRADREWRQRLQLVLLAMRDEGDELLPQARIDWLTATEHLVDDIGKVADLARKSGQAQWSIDLRKGAAMLKTFAAEQTVRRTFTLDDAKPIISRMTDVRLLVAELLGMGLGLSDNQREVGNTGFARAALAILAPVSGTTIASRTLDAFVAAAAKHAPKNKKPREAARKLMAQLVAVELVEPAGNGKSKKGAWRITDDGLLMHSEHAAGK